MKEYTVRVHDDGTKAWYLEGKRHREDGPAYEGADGDKYWCIEGQYHREDGPAIEYASGAKEWYKEGNRHREDGPAIERANGSKYWWLEGKRHSEQEFNRRMSPVKEMSIAELEKVLGYKLKVVR